MNLVPHRIIRAPKDCKTVAYFQSMDRLLPDGSIEPGTTIEHRQAAGRGWRWCGRIWFWTDWQ